MIVSECESEREKVRKEEEEEEEEEERRIERDGERWRTREEEISLEYPSQITKSIKLLNISTPGMEESEMRVESG